MRNALLFYKLRSMAFLSTKPYKGTRDFYPDQMNLHNWMFENLRLVAQSFGYSEYNGPLLESFELYHAKTGEEIVQNQLYWFLDKKQRKVALRPEMTPTMARMVASRLHELPLPIRWFSFPNLWRYERPQRGRLREHWQFNIDLLGGDPLLADGEMLQIAYESMRVFKGESHFKLRINHKMLTDFFLQKHLKVPSHNIPKVFKLLDLFKKLSKTDYESELKGLDFSNQQVEDLNGFFEISLKEAFEKYPCQGSEDLKKLTELLEKSESFSALVLDTSILRGMDYYTGLVFEAYDNSQDNPRALFGGGRYDHLIELFSSKKLSGIGFGLGDVTLKNFLETHQLLPSLPEGVDVWITLSDMKHQKLVQDIAQGLRQESLKPLTSEKKALTSSEHDHFLLRGPFRERKLKVGVSLSPKKLSQDLKIAHKQKAWTALIIADNELKQNKVIIKNLKTSHQTTLSLGDGLGKKIYDFMVKDGGD